MPDLVVAARQQVTREWFALRAHAYQLFVSQLVVSEALAGDEDAARERRAFGEQIPGLAVTDSAGDLAGNLVQSGAVPPVGRRRRFSH